MEGGVAFGQEELEAQAFEQIEQQEEMVVEGEVATEEQATEPSELELLQTRYDQAIESNQKLTGVIEGFQQTQVPETVTEPGYTTPAHAENLEEMSREEFSDYNSSRLIGKINAEVVEPLLGQINSLRQNIEKESLDAEVLRLSVKHPDLLSWEKEIQEVYKSTHGVTLEQARLLARNSNPTKAAELDKKFAKPVPATPTQELAKVSSKLPEISLRPNSGQIPVAHRGISFKEASSNAWGKLGPDLTAALRQANLDD